MKDVLFVLILVSLKLLRIMRWIITAKQVSIFRFKCEVSDKNFKVFNYFVTLS